MAHSWADAGNEFFVVPAIGAPDQRRWAGAVDPPVVFCRSYLEYDIACGDAVLTLSTQEESSLLPEPT
ncbi:MAG: hypothetical protein QM673_12745 [Gordonia sp. (in: high G+C Gram-positive bacteria)]